MLSVTYKLHMLSVIMPSVVMLSVVAQSRARATPLWEHAPENIRLGRHCIRVLNTLDYSAVMSFTAVKIFISPISAQQRNKKLFGWRKKNVFQNFDLRCHGPVLLNFYRCNLQVCKNVLVTAIHFTHGHYVLWPEAVFLVVCDPSMNEL